MSSGRFLGRGSICLCVVAFAFQSVILLRAYGKGWGTERARILSSLERSGSRHLVIVRYGADHAVRREWVYNEADIDKARVVWARDMGVSMNPELLEYYKDRQVWMLNPDATPPKLVPYESEGGISTVVPNGSK